MTAARTALTAIVIGYVINTPSGVNVQCPAGTMVYSLSVWSGHWLDGLYVRCTGDSDEQAIPDAFDEDPGGGEDADICAGTAGLQSIEWLIPSEHENLISYLNITCLNNETYRFADR